MGFTSTEENYIKAIFHLSEDGDDAISTNDIARQISASAASVTDMLKKLKQKKIVTYEKYQGVRLTKEGDNIAKSIVRKHRLWEVFLVEKLGYSWDKIHDIAEQLEHIQSEEMINKLDKFLGFPRFDPHGDPIPDASLKIKTAQHNRPHKCYSLQGNGDISYCNNGTAERLCTKPYPYLSRDKPRLYTLADLLPGSVAGK